MSLGYCPQFDALFPRLTTRQHLEFYGSVKGVPHELLEEKVTNFHFFVHLKKNKIYLFIATNH